MTELEPFPVRELGRTGLQVSVPGFGGGPVGWRATPDAEAEADRLMIAAWAAGIRYFDTAPFYGYGNSERRVGRFLATQARGSFVLSTKVGRLIRPAFPGDRSPEQVRFDYSREGVLRSVEESLERLGTGRIDIALIHDIDGWTHGTDQPERFRQALEGAYPALAELKAQGLIRAIGLGVNEWQVCEDFARAVPVDCILLAGRHSLLQQDAARQFTPFCAEHGIGLVIGGPYNSGILASGDVDGALYDYAPAKPEIRQRVRRIQAVADRFGVRLGAAALAFVLRSAPVATVIPGVATVEELQTTLAFARATVPEALWAALVEAGLIMA